MCQRASKSGATIAEPGRGAAPSSWGEWPPAQERLDAVAARAVAAARAIASKRAPDDQPVIELWMKSPDDFAITFFAKTAETVTIGSILIPALRLGWMIVWEPATNAGRLWEHRAAFDFEQESLRRGRRRAR